MTDKVKVFINKRTNQLSIILSKKKLGLKKKPKFADIKNIKFEF